MRGRALLRTVLPPLVPLVAVTLLIEIAVRQQWVRAFLVPVPSTVARTLWHEAPQFRALLLETTTAVAQAHDRGLRVNVWTVNEPDQILRLRAAGVDGVITDVPDLALEVLRA